MRLTIKVHVARFDAVKVINATDRASYAAFKAIGAFIRQRAKTSIRPVPKKTRGDAAISRPGRPPYGHVGRLRRLIRFAATSKGVVIGPEVASGSLTPAALPALEYGGPSFVRDRRTGASRRTNVRARPFMTPALRAELPGIPALWRDSVR
jgi:hypothetical protein